MLMNSERFSRLLKGQKGYAVLLGRSDQNMGVGWVGGVQQKKYLDSIPDFRVSDIDGVLQLVLPGQASTQPLDHAVAQNLQVAPPTRSWKAQRGV